MMTNQSSERGPSIEEEFLIKALSNVNKLVNDYCLEFSNNEKLSSKDNLLNAILDLPSHFWSTFLQFDYKSEKTTVNQREEHLKLLQLNFGNNNATNRELITKEQLCKTLSRYIVFIMEEGLAKGFGRFVFHLANLPTHIQSVVFSKMDSSMLQILAKVVRPSSVMAVLIQNQIKIKFVSSLLFRFIFNQELYVGMIRGYTFDIKPHVSWKLCLVRKSDIKIVNGRIDKNDETKSLAQLYLLHSTDVRSLDVKCRWTLAIRDDWTDVKMMERLLTIFGDDREAYSTQTVETLQPFSKLFWDEDQVFSSSISPLMTSLVKLKKKKDVFHRAFKLFHNDTEFEWILHAIEYVEPLPSGTTSSLSPVSSEFCTAIRPLTRINIRPELVSPISFSSTLREKLAKEIQMIYDFHLHATAANQLVFAKYFSKVFLSEEKSQEMLQDILYAFDMAKITKGLASTPRIIDMIKNGDQMIRVVSMQARLNDILNDTSLSNAFIVAATTPPSIVSPFVDFGNFKWLEINGSDWKNACFYPIEGNAKDIPNPLVKHQFSSVTTFQDLTPVDSMSNLTVFKRSFRKLASVYKIHVSTL